ncbi:MAG: hypothetical protein ABI640_18700 [Gammaproteobacteria bacterium]
MLQSGLFKHAAALVLFAAAAVATAQEGGKVATRTLVTYVRVKPAAIDTWRMLQRDQVVPALKKAGLKQYTVYETLVGDQTEFVIVRPLASFAEFNGPDLLEKALGARGAATLNSRLRGCIDGSHSRIENSRDEFYLDPGAASTLFVSRYRAMPGRAGDYMNFVRNEMMPLARRAQQNHTFAGWSVTTSVQGGEPNLITLNMFYDDFAPLDGPPPLAATLGPEGVAEFLRKGAGLISQVEQSVLKRLPDLSY